MVTFLEKKPLIWHVLGHRQVMENDIQAGNGDSSTAAKHPKRGRPDWCAPSPDAERTADG
jgi:hypothetical protein